MGNVKMSTESRWTGEAKKLLVGRKIVSVRYMDAEEAEEMGWFSRPLAFELDNGVWLYASRDDEGNDGGALFTTDDKMPVIPVI